MKAGLVSALLLLALLVASTALVGQEIRLSQADSPGTWVENHENGNPVYMWSDDCWDTDPEYASSNMLSVEIDFGAMPNGDPYIGLQGERDTDPILRETITNSSGATWYQWRVSIFNGVIDRVDRPSVHNVATGADGANWTIAWAPLTIREPMVDWFTVTSTGEGSSIASGESLSVRFRWAPLSPFVSIGQYPVGASVPVVPEPSSVLALTSALASLGLPLIRRR